MLSSPNFGLPCLALSCLSRVMLFKSHTIKYTHVYLCFVLWKSFYTRIENCKTCDVRNKLRTFCRQLWSSFLSSPKTRIGIMKELSWHIFIVFLKWGCDTNNYKYMARLICVSLTALRFPFSFCMPLECKKSHLVMNEWVHLQGQNI